MPRLHKVLDCDAATLRACILMLLERGILSDQNAGRNAATRRELTALHGRDPTAQLDHYRRARMEGPIRTGPSRPRGRRRGAGLHRRLDVLLLGDCDVQMETDFLRREAARAGIDLRAAASFPAESGWPANVAMTPS